VGQLPVRPQVRISNGRVSQVPGEPCCAYALRSDPGRTDAPGPTVRRRGPRLKHDEGSRKKMTFEAQ
jgi:hypothetical protein